MATRSPPILIGLAIEWLLATASLTAADPVPPPDLSNCLPPGLPPGVSVNCCIPNSPEIVDFKPPPTPVTLRVRRAAHELDDLYILKYRTAITLMKNLPPDDPWSFMHQANVHCAYCNGAYEQSGFPGFEFQVHNSWLFFPFHRAYLYFYERILGKLMNDSTFAIPFWNWDAPAGMTMPSAYTDAAESSIFDALRDPLHQPPNITDLNFSGEDDTSTTNSDLIANNLKTMYRQMVSGSRTPELFLGSPYRAGDYPDPGPGSIESIPHSTVHMWTGDRTQPNGEDMGIFYSAGRDPMFFAHHANVDRMWDIWTRQLNGTNFNDTDWLDASFLLWDENKQLVRIRVRDVLHTGALGYTYEPVSIPWLQTPPTPVSFPPTIPAPAFAQPAFPLKLEKAVSLGLKRPVATVTRAGKEEVVVVENITVDCRVYAKFDSYINVGTGQIGSVTPGSSQLAGSFVHVPMGGNEGSNVTVIRALALGVSDVFKDIGVDGTGSVVVTLVRRTPEANITVGGLRIDLIPR